MTAAAQAWTRYWRFEAVEVMPFPGAESIFSVLCGAISGRLRFAVRPLRAATSATGEPWFKRSAMGFSGLALITRAATADRMGPAAMDGAAATEPDNSAVSFRTSWRTNIEQRRSLGKRIFASMS